LANVWTGSGAFVVRDLLPNVEGRVRSFAEGFVRLVRNASKRESAKAGS
jgi:hypothetical protein